MTKPTLNLLTLSNTPIYEQLQLEEALLRADTNNYCLINHGSPPAIVMGISGKAKELIDQNHVKDIPVIRRFSGGGTVVVDENTLFVTMICNKEDVDTSPFPKQILCWNGNLFKQSLKEHRYSVKENDYAIDDRKFGGNAQYICKNRWLHHSTLLWDYNPTLMKALTLPPKMPVYREQRPHTDFLCKLNTFLQKKEEFLTPFTSTLEEHFALKPISYEDISHILQRPHRTATQKTTTGAAPGKSIKVDK